MKYASNNLLTCILHVPACKEALVLDRVFTSLSVPVRLLRPAPRADGETPRMQPQTSGFYTEQLLRRRKAESQQLSLNFWTWGEKKNTFGINPEKHNNIWVKLLELEKKCFYFYVSACAWCCNNCEIALSHQVHRMHNSTYPDITGGGCSPGRRKIC